MTNPFFPGNARNMYYSAWFLRKQIADWVGKPDLSLMSDHAVAREAILTDGPAHDLGCELLALLGLSRFEPLYMAEKLIALDLTSLASKQQSSDSTISARISEMVSAAKSGAQ